MAARRVILEGRVQGVGFRYFVLQKSKEFEVEGWVKNLPSGEVELRIEGEEEELDRFLSAVRKGPRMARVTNVGVESVDAENPGGFSIRR